MKFSRELEILKENIDRYNDTPLAVRALKAQFVNLNGKHLTRTCRQELYRLLGDFNKKFFAPKGRKIRFTSCGMMSIDSIARLQ